MSIVKMKRLRLIGMRSEREEMLRLLQHMGCVEIDEPSDWRDDPDWASLTRPDTAALNQAREAKSGAEAALKTLKKYAPKEKGSLFKPRPVITEAALFDNEAYRAALDDAGRLNALERQISALYAEQGKLKAQKLALAPWLALDIPLETASTQDVAVFFGTVAAAVDLDALEGALAAGTDLAALLRAGSDAELHYFVLLCHKSQEETCQAVLKEYGFSRSALRGWTGTAAENDRALDARMAETEEALRRAKEEAAGCAPKAAALEQCLDRACQEITREEARCRLLDTDLAFFFGGMGARTRRGEASGAPWEVHLLLGDRGPGGGGLPGGTGQAQKQRAYRAADDHYGDVFPAGLRRGGPQRPDGPVLYFLFRVYVRRPGLRPDPGGGLRLPPMEG